MCNNSVNNCKIEHDQPLGSLSINHRDSIAILEVVNNWKQLIIDPGIIINSWTPLLINHGTNNSRLIMINNWESLLINHSSYQYFNVEDYQQLKATVEQPWNQHFNIFTAAAIVAKEQILERFGIWRTTSALLQIWNFECSNSRPKSNENPINLPPFATQTADIVKPGNSFLPCLTFQIHAGNLDFSRMVTWCYSRHLEFVLTNYQSLA